MTDDTMSDHGATEDNSIRFNPFKREFINNPYPFYRQLRRLAPFHRTMNMLILTRFQDVKAVLGSPQFSSAAIPDLVQAFEKKTQQSHLHLLHELGRKAIVFTDKPEHTRLRRLVGHGFSKDSVEPFGNIIGNEIYSLVQRFENLPNKEFIGELADRVPLQVLLRIMGLPLEDAGRISQWSAYLRYLLEPGFLTPNRLQKIYDILKSSYDYFRRVCINKYKRSDTDLISALIHYQADDGDRLSEEEVVFSCIMVFVAGKETTKCLLGNGTALLARYPQVYDKLRSDLSLIPAAIQEMLRFDSPLQYTKRICREDVSLNGESIFANEQVLLCLGAANRDTDQFKDADMFFPEREQAANLAMGHGIHNCLGTVLSKLIAEKFFATIGRRWKNMVSVEAEPPRIDSSFILRGYKTLPLRITLD